MTRNIARLFLAGRVAAVMVVLSIAPAAGAGTTAEAGVHAVRAKLLANGGAIQPGGTFTVGVLLDMEPGWHVYWINPGDSGLPPSVKIKMPEGFTVGAICFPTPVRFDQPGDLVAYGYSGSVLLTAEVKAPADLKGLANVKVEAAVSWLVCSEACVPGAAKLEMDLPVSEHGVPVDEPTARLFRDWAARLPVAEAQSPDVEKLEWVPDPSAAAGTLNVTWKRNGDAGKVKDVNLFPAPDDAVDVTTAGVRRDGEGTSITARTHTLAGQKLRADPLPAVLGYTTADGQRRGVKTVIPVAALSAKAAKSSGASK